MFVFDKLASLPCLYLSLAVESRSSSWCFWATHGLPYIDGAGVQWVLTGTHQRAVTSRQDDVTAERSTLCGWCREVLWSWMWSSW